MCAIQKSPVGAGHDIHINDPMSRKPTRVYQQTNINGRPRKLEITLKQDNNGKQERTIDCNTESIIASKYTNISTLVMQYQTTAG